jgi:hypothetical protein
MAAGAGTVRGEVLGSPAPEVVAQRMAENPGRSLTGRRIGSYQIQSLLGTGGMGEVYRANDAKLGRDVAITLRSAAVQCSQRAATGALGAGAKRMPGSPHPPHAARAAQRDRCACWQAPRRRRAPQEKH